MKQLLLAILVAVCVVSLLGSRRVVTEPQTIHHGTVNYGTIEGVVLKPDGQPVSQAIVFAEGENFIKGLMPFTKTDEQGRFVIKRLEPRTYKVYASKEEDGYPSATSAFHTGGAVVIPQVSVSEGQVTSNVVVYLAPKAAKLIARVEDAATRRPVKDAQITLRRVDNPNFYFITGPDQQGKAKILVPAAPITVEVSAPRQETKHIGPIRLKREEIKNLVIYLPRKE